MLILDSSTCLGTGSKDGTSTSFIMATPFFFVDFLLEVLTTYGAVYINPSNSTTSGAPEMQTQISLSLALSTTVCCTVQNIKPNWSKNIISAIYQSE